MKHRPIHSKNNKKYALNLLLVMLVVLITILPLYFLRNAAFTGSDNKAKDAILELQKDYNPWFSPVFQPPSTEIESLLFALQAAAGAGIIGYGLGYMNGHNHTKEQP